MVTGCLQNGTMEHLTFYTGLERCLKGGCNCIGKEEGRLRKEDVVLERH